MTVTRRCAVYTRKSSEEGLEQGFNSLDAQRESCAAYILSQAGEGWTSAPGDYDDGGYSGGTMERPGIQALMAQIKAGRVDVVVVYKVDRLTRSLADFARLVELFDKHNVSFVSVTQAFNTTTSMGRLTLNVLLSFAQFEREVTGERIRDKIAASKAKGMWMGGRPPLGYDGGADRRLVINKVEAEFVRRIFRRYLELGSVYELAVELEASGVRSKFWLGRKGVMLGGAILGRGALYHMLSNPVYRGAIRHRDKVYEGAHPSIIGQALWDDVQTRLAQNAREQPAAPRLVAAPLLKDLAYDARGVPMSIAHTVRRGRRYRYYVSRRPPGVARPHSGRVSRIAVGALDRFALSETMLRLRTDFMQDSDEGDRVRAALVRVGVTAEDVKLQIRHEAASSKIYEQPGRLNRLDDGVEVVLAVILKHRQGATIIDGPEGPAKAGRVDRALVRAIALARSWAERLANGNARSLKELALSEGYCEHYAARLLPLAWLAPDLAEFVLEGQQPLAISLGALTKSPLPVNWSDQRRLFAEVGRRTVA